METTYRKLTKETVHDVAWPQPLEVTPNHMGINLCAVEGMSLTRTDDGQLVNLTTHFLPEYA